MTRAERIKARWLLQCSLLPGSWDKRFIKNMAFQAEHNPTRPITDRQKYNLDLMVYRYRRQLAGSLPDELMITVTPLKADYLIEDEPQTVPDLFTGKEETPHETETHSVENHPQRDLF